MRGRSFQEAHSDRRRLLVLCGYLGILPLSVTIQPALFYQLPTVHLMMVHGSSVRRYLDARQYYQWLQRSSTETLRMYPKMMYQTIMISLFGP